MNQRTVFSTLVLLAVAMGLPGMTLATETGNSAAVALPIATTTVAGQEITKEQAIEMALKAHPGKVTKAYEDTKKGKKTWEIKIKGDDGKKWEVYYEIKTGELIAEESE